MSKIMGSLRNPSNQPYFFKRSAGKLFQLLIFSYCIASLITAFVVVRVAEEIDSTHLSSSLKIGVLIVLAIQLFLAWFAMFFYLGPHQGIRTKKEVLPVDLLSLWRKAEKEEESEEFGLDATRAAKRFQLLTFEILERYLSRELRHVQLLMREHKDLKEEHRSFKQLPLFRRVIGVTAWIFGLALTAIGLLIIYHGVARGSLPLRILLGSLPIFVGGFACWIEYISRTKVTWRSDQALEDFMKEMGIE